MVCWVSIFVFCAAVLRVAENLPLEDDISALKYPSSENAFSDEEKELGDALSRDKRTIGILRQIFPGLSQIVDRKIQMLTRLAFRLIGRLVLRGGAGGGGGTGTASSGDSGRKVSITLPTYPPSVDDDEDEDSEDSEDSTSTTAPDATTAEGDAATTEASESENQVAESKVSEVKVRKVRDTEKVNNNADQEPAATGDNDNDNDLDSSDTDGEGSEDSPRNKRLLNFNLGGAGGGGGGGSGNFLFDIIRLVAGSGTTQEKDEAENAPLEDGSIAASADGGVGVGVGVGLTGKDDGYSAGVPGPLTRLFVIANRGIANLLQDLILRLAQTSERIVNFKARLITSII